MHEFLQSTFNFLVPLTFETWLNVKHLSMLTVISMSHSLSSSIAQTVHIKFLRKIIFLLFHFNASKKNHYFNFPETFSFSESFNVKVKILWRKCSRTLHQIGGMSGKQFPTENPNIIYELKTDLRQFYILFWYLTVCYQYQFDICRVHIGKLFQRKKKIH